MLLGLRDKIANEILRQPIVEEILFGKIDPRGVFYLLRKNETVRFIAVIFLTSADAPSKTV